MEINIIEDKIYKVEEEKKKLMEKLKELRDEEVINECHSTLR